MKNLFYTLCLLLTVAVGQSYASSNADLFSAGDVSIETVFAPIDQLADVVANNPEADLNFVQVNFASAINEVSLMNQLMNAARPMEDRPAAGISGYVWGACLGFVGVAIVYFLLDDASTEFRKKEVTHAVVGCVVATVVWVVVYYAIIAAAIAGA
jgi:hypothetical protein